ncbi:S49 family peptidase [Pseudaestuariivita rosea]|uniref:S49 family peptidase n=1 Tax=Pseudaestuariivita rosea TaxID=2763263 RepID=UPI001ABA181E|nr:S49 family peptidase [Pseudaestuariivita rosea]
MTVRTVATLVSDAPVVLAPDHARSQLQQTLPDQTAASPNGQVAGETSGIQITQGLGIVPVRGVLTPNNDRLARWFGWSTYHGIAQAVQDLAAAPSVTAIVLELDTPGGMALGASGAAEAIAAAGRVKPVHAFVDPLAASGGYWLASQARDITMAPGSLVGSIGVMQMASAPVGPSLFGDRLYVLTSSHARAKAPDPSTDRGQTELQRALDEVEAEFAAAVQRGRGMTREQFLAANAVSQDVTDGGATFSPAVAQTRGFADATATREVFYDRMMESYPPKSAQRPQIRSARGRQAKAQAARAIAATG